MLLPTVYFFCSLTEVYSLGFSFSYQRGVSRNTHKACLAQGCGPARRRKGHFKIHRGFSLKFKNSYSFCDTEIFSLEKQSTFAFVAQTHNKTNGFSTLLERTHSKTNGFSTFVSEKVKPMVF